MSRVDQNPACRFSIAAERGGIDWVSENANMSARARAYDSGAMGGRDGLAPRLSATDDFGTVTAKFDGVDDTGSVLIDRKLSVYGSVKADKQLLRQSAVLSENGWQGVWELPTEAAARAARAKMARLGVPNINVRVVPE